ncbi:unnamed protein product (macronuclear) [Paramecium tetraurelia]|uniref:Uncharacterized protein n=1 Tax=Paramecium tetraurelia TaxID=5888 RepID=A0E708_PARTE|nr:uncharacterized protein GSPATT00023803001 [Paramecium tetraurelia]CAK91075.1 unnamed protein product [Paramecium tetraurelia]|eukprot:XP_001458472.1 hypothetical protein (macronuclear) [Paramecium tetraurelia strain d4-2]
MKKTQGNGFRVRDGSSKIKKAGELLASLQYSIKCKSYTPQHRSIKQLTNYPLKTQAKQDVKPLVQPRNAFQRQTSINCQQRPSLLSVITSESNMSADEEYEIWDNNQDLRVQKMTIEESKPSVGQFLQLYKARFGGFPGQKQCIRNEDVIKVAVEYASTNKQLFKKYFPKKQIVGRSSFLEFQQFFQNIRSPILFLKSNTSRI